MWSEPDMSEIPSLILNSFTCKLSVVRFWNVQCVLDFQFQMDKENEAITKSYRNPISYWDSIAF
jgi:hypothetical protein